MLFLQRALLLSPAELVLLRCDGDVGGVTAEEVVKAAIEIVSDHTRVNCWEPFRWLERWDDSLDWRD